MTIRRRAKSTAVGRRIRAMQLAKEAKDKKEEAEKETVAIETMPVVEEKVDEFLDLDEIDINPISEKSNFRPLDSYVHPTMEKLDRLLQEDGVPMERLKDAFVHMNKEVLRQTELCDLMGAKEIGLVTQSAKIILDLKIKEEAKRPKRGGKKKAAAPIKQTKEEIEAEFSDLM